MNDSWILVDNRQKLESAQDDISGASHIGIDTEYDSFRYFREKLCLIQICTESRAYIFDPLLDIDISFLGNIFTDINTIKILHACDNDIRLLNRDYGFRFKNIFDTYRAASTLGSTSLSLTSIIWEYLGVKLKKTKNIQRSRWDIRPLSEKQLDYAALDTRYLIDLYFRLRKNLMYNGLEKKAKTAFEKITHARWSEKTFNPKGFSRIEGCDDLDDFQMKRLKTLYRWRFETAKRTNTAVFMVLSDRNIIDLSKNDRQEIESLSETGIISAAKSKSFGPEIIKILRETV